MRGEAAADIAALRETILRVAELALAFPEISELDLNPLLVRSEGQGAIALDARMII